MSEFTPGQLALAAKVAPRLREDGYSYEEIVEH